MHGHILNGLNFTSKRYVCTVCAQQLIIIIELPVSAYLAKVISYCHGKGNIPIIVYVCIMYKSLGLEDMESQAFRHSDLCQIIRECHNDNYLLNNHGHKYSQ